MSRQRQNHRNAATAPGRKKTWFLRKVFSFLVFFIFYVLMYEDRTRNYDPEIHKRYLIYDTPLPLSRHL